MEEPVYGVRSDFEGISWPALPTQRGATLLSLLFQFDDTQWWPAERLVEHQLKQMKMLLEHAWETVPFIPTAQFVIPTAYRSNVSGLLISPVAFLWNVEKK